MVKSETRTSTKWNRREKWDAEHTQNKLKILQGEINKKQKLYLNCSYYWNTINKKYQNIQEIVNLKNKGFIKNDNLPQLPNESTEVSNQWKTRFNRTIIFLLNRKT